MAKNIKKIAILFVIIFLTCGVKNVMATKINTSEFKLTTGGSERMYEEYFAGKTSVFCVQHGMNINPNGADYCISQQYNTSNSILAYILNDDTANNTENAAYDPISLAIWKFLYIQKKCDDYNNITSNGSISSGDWNTDETKNLFYTTDWNQGLELYNEAISYANKISAGVSIKIDNYEVGDTYIKFHVKGNYEEIKIYLNDSSTEYTNYSYNSDTGYYSVSKTAVTGGVTKVKIVGYMDELSAKYRILTSDGNQRLLVVTDLSSNQVSDDDELKLKTDVSVQKYVWKVNDNFIYRDNNENTRYNTYTDESLYDKQTYNFDTNSDTMVSFNKKDNPVSVRVGDKVTYKIIVYNNLSNVAKNIKVMDDNLDSSAYVNKIYDNSENDVDYKFENYSYNNNYKTYYWTISELNGASNQVYYVDITYTNESTINQTTNEPWSSSNQVRVESENNEKNYRTYDLDYVVIEGYAVSLEKFVSSVGSENIEFKPYTGTRKDKQIWSDTDEYKKKNKVSVEVCDTVRYTIKIKNDSANTFIANFVDEADAKLNIQWNENYVGWRHEYIGYQSIYDEESKKFYNTNYTYGYNSDNTKKVLSLSQITLYPGTTTVKLEYIVGSEGTEIQNRAYIESLKIYNTNVTVNKGNNCEDKDWVQTKTYSVSLEKYVTKVGTSINLDPSTERVNHPYYKQNNFSKNSNPVKLEVGDTVTYTIKLTNLGEEAVKNLVIEETPETGLEYVSCTKVTIDDAKFTYTGTINPNGR